MTNVISGKFPSVVMPVEKDDSELSGLAKTALTHLGVKEEGTELSRCSNDLSIKNNHQYLMNWLKDYFSKYDAEEGAMKQLLPRLKEHLACQESYFA
ncbi:hypothetical protein A3767_01350 [Oleiphilus sp. HI0133]|nr:hypothetical protein A3767_01350 [Oleiphilus sp. HI0133]